MFQAMLIFVCIFFYIVFCVGFGLLSGYINEKKGCNYWTGFWCGFIFGVLGLIIVAVQKNQNVNSTPTTNINNNTIQNNANELKAYKELLDSGAITQEEYETKKKQLLNL